MANDNRLGETIAEVPAGKLLNEGITQRNNQLESTLSEYQDLFELIPCIVTVQDRNYRLLRFNREFGEKFAPALGDYCYNAYKGRSEKCPVCPVEKTFEDGQSHWSEEKGLNKDGTEAYWIVKTAPIKNAKGEIIAAMEMCLDITYRKELEQRLKITKALEQRLKITEKKYQAIFNNIPNSVFVLDADTLDIFDCNESVRLVYGYSPEEVVGKSFLDLFRSEQREYYASKLRKFAAIDQARHFTKDGRTIFVGIGISPSEFFGKTVLIVTTNDITRRLETEQQLIQASKMATLGEMATGVAHELNQPLSVIKTASSFFIRKINRKERIDDDVFLNIANKISGNIDRATRIINHMREFGRKSDMDLVKVQVNEVLRRAHEVLSQQLRLRGIEVIFSLEENLPEVMAGPSRLEQVFINLLVNARDAIEEKSETVKERTGEEKIIVKTSSEGKTVTVQVTDTGHGIPETILNKIFEPFFTTKQPGKGTGLGLSISYGIIKDFGGSIYALSSGDKGATFVIKLPVPNEK